MSAIDAQDIAQKILDSMGVPAQIVIESEYPIYLTVNSEDSALMIGKGGETLRAFQAVVNMLYRNKHSDGGYVGVDINGYKKERVEKVQALAQELADKVRDTGDDQHLNPMNAFERRSVHTLLAENPDVVTGSEGEGIDRHVVIKKR